MKSFPWSDGPARDQGGPAQPLLIVKGLTKLFPIKGGFLQARRTVSAVDGIDFTLSKGETLGIVGESGCGKSTTSRLISHLIEPTEGEIIFDGELVGSRNLSLKEFRRQVQMVFQDSFASLNPRLTIEDTIAFAPRVHGVPQKKAKAQAHELLDAVGLSPSRFARRFPHELSGGQRQRINIARALAMRPRLMILDEPVSALDKSVEAQVLNLLVDLKAQYDLTYMFISHDLNVVQYMSDRVMVMYLGRLAEVGDTREIYERPAHPYTSALLASRPSMTGEGGVRQPPLSGDPPSPLDPPSGCRFRTRCPHSVEACAASAPPLTALSVLGHLAACIRAGEIDLSPQTPAPLPSRDRASSPREARSQLDGDVPPLVRAENLSVAFRTPDGIVQAVNGVDFKVRPGKTLCILGESGSGKSVTLRALMRLNPPKRTVLSGALSVTGRDLLRASEREIDEMRGKDVAMIFQEPMTALDPVFTIGSQIAESVVRHEGATWSAARQRALDLLELVQVPSARSRLDAYPHELSGGMRQRAMIAIALSCRPKLLLADEPTTALDATVQIQILLLLRRLQEELAMGMVFVTHDLGVAGEISDDIAVMYAGRIVEAGRTVSLLRSPTHPYTQGLMGATVKGGVRGTRLTTIPGSPPPLDALPPGCSFAPRCAFVRPVCNVDVPPAERHSDGRLSRCHVAAGALEEV